MSTPDLTTVQGYRPIAVLIPAGWQEGAASAADGTALHYWRTGGARPPLLLIHGFQSAGLSWLRTAQALQDTHDVVLADCRGHGGSGGPERGFSLDLLAADAADLIRALGMERPVVLGHSMGAEIALRLAAARPELVGGLILADPPMRPFTLPDSPEAQPWIQRWLEYMRALKTQSHAERLASALTMMPPATSGWGEEDFAAHVEAQVQFNLDVINHSRSMPYGADASARFARVTCPILLLLGAPARGGGVDEAALAQIEASWRQGEVVRFPDAGHFIHIEDFPAFIASARRFLASPPAVGR